MKNDKEKYLQHSRITDWPENERPREKLLEKGWDKETTKFVTKELKRFKKTLQSKK